MQLLKKHYWRVTACVLMLLLQAACVHGFGGDFCKIYIPVYSSAQDSAQTQDQIDANNAAWLALCVKSQAQ